MASIIIQIKQIWSVWSHVYLKFSLYQLVRKKHDTNVSMTSAILHWSQHELDSVSNFLKISLTGANKRNGYVSYFSLFLYCWFEFTKPKKTVGRKTVWKACVYLFLAHISQKNRKDLLVLFAVLLNCRFQYPFIVWILNPLLWENKYHYPDRNG